MSKKAWIGPLLVILFATGVGGSLRLALAARGDFPLNDGGMFFVMVKDVLQNHFALPWYTSYNGGQIPFCYPPLPFYLAAGLLQVSRAPLLALFQYLPAILSTLTIPAFYGLGYSLTQSRAKAALAALAFALLPRAFIWPIMGGGLSRALGLLMAILALTLLAALFLQSRKWMSIGAALACSATLLSHPEIAWFLFCSALLLAAGAALGYRRKRHAWRQILRHILLPALGVGLGTLLLTAPWWVVVLQRHGVDTFLAPFQVRAEESAPLVRLLLFSYSDEAFTQLIGALAIVGLIVELLQRRYFLPTWLALTVFLSLRNAPYISMIQVALFAAAALDELILPGVEGLSRRWLPPDSPNEVIARRTSRARLSVQGILLGYLLFSAFGFMFLPNSSLRRLPQADREAMAWIEANTPPASRFAILQGQPTWETDMLSEWFPALSGRVSVATVQGNEWFPGEYASAQAAYISLQECFTKDTPCLETWEIEFDKRFNYLYLADPERRSTLWGTLMDATEYSLVYQNSAAAVFLKKSQ